MHTASLVVTGFRPVDQKTTETSTPSAPTSTSEETFNAATHDEVELSDLTRRLSPTGSEVGGLKNRSRSHRTSTAVGNDSPHGDRNGDPDIGKVPMKEVSIAVVEQRVSNLAQGMLCESTAKTSV